MADKRPPRETESREAHPPPFDRKGFESSPEFANFRQGMKHILSVSKADLDMKVKEAKENSPRADNPNAAGRKPKAKRLDG